jgi:hypothetical protein
VAASVGSLLVESCVGWNIDMGMIRECSLDEGKAVKLHAVRVS